jgi:hypothetical protein
MAGENEIKTKKPKSSLIGNQAKPTVLDSTTKLDIDTNKVLMDNIIEAGLNSTLDTAALERFTTISNSRDQIYQLIDTMCQDSAVSSIVRTYTEDVCEPADSGHVVWCESPDPQISKFVNYLLNVINVDKNIFSWVYCLIKYGDVYLRLYRESDYDDPMFKKEKRTALNENLQAADKEKAELEEAVKISLHAANDQYSYYIEMVPDPGTMFELTKFGQTYGYIEVPNNPTTFDQSSFVGGTTGLMSSNPFTFNYKSGDVNIYQADDFVHACLEDNISRIPETVDLFYEDPEAKNTGVNHSYKVRRGKSLLYDAYKIWREKALLESAILLSRITRSGIVRKVSVEVGDMPKEQVQQTLRRVKELFEQKSAINNGQSFSEYNNPGAVENFIYHATHDGKGAITVESVGGDFDPKQLTDLDWWNNKFYSSFGIPKQYFGWTDDGAGFNGGSSLTIISSVYSKGVKRIQNTILQAITDIINLILLNKGCKAYLNNFVLKMQAPITQEELDRRENLNNRANAISSINSLFSDVEDKARRLTILKSLVAPLHLGDEVMDIIQKEVEAAEEAARKAKEAEEADAAAASGTGDSDLVGLDTDTDIDDSAEEVELDLSAMPDSEITEEDFKADESKTILVEDGILIEDADDLPTPEEADTERDFTENL